MDRLQLLRDRGQAVWLDYLRRGLITSGELERLVAQGVTGVTSNPTIFQKAVEGSTDYDHEISAAVAREPDRGALGLMEHLMVADVRMACDVLRPVFDSTSGGDGYVSLEVAPDLANDAEATFTEARRLHRLVERPNLLVKVPATPSGIEAGERLLAAGVAVNFTLVFSPRHYDACARAFLRGARRYLAEERDPSRLHSVASVFVSRTDSVVDHDLEAIGTTEATGLMGAAAIANARLVYARFRELLETEEYQALLARGVRAQRLLWASTSAKNPAYRDVCYVEELIGRDTINTLPPATLAAFQDHGEVRGDTVASGADEAAAVVRRLRTLAIDVGAIGERLQIQGLELFAASWDDLLAAVSARRGTARAAAVATVSATWPEGDARPRAIAGGWHDERVLARVWRHDVTVWKPAGTPEIADRLGWLSAPELLHEDSLQLTAPANRLTEADPSDAVLLGMGGSSLAPEAMQEILGNAPGRPRLRVLDSSHPDQVLALARAVDPARTRFIVSSKSGTTAETVSLMRYFYDRADNDGRWFIAITDPGTWLEAEARRLGFQAVVRATPDVGGRYSALIQFGLVPAALTGVHVRRLLGRARIASEASSFCAAADNPAVQLASAVCAALEQGRDKLTFLLPRRWGPFGDWVEQLIAESTGKENRGLVPVVGEPRLDPTRYAADRCFVVVGTSDEIHNMDDFVGDLERAGHPVLRQMVRDTYDIAQLFFFWEMAVALAGRCLGINPFDQPDVESAKRGARDSLAELERSGALPRRPSVAADNAAALRAFLGEARPGDYVALQAFIPRDAANAAALQALREGIARRTGLATTSGFGPRFLHSTGQLHKGGPNTCLALQVVDQPGEDVPVPGERYTFGALVAAQAIGDYDALLARGRRVLRVDIGTDRASGLRALTSAMGG